MAGDAHGDKTQEEPKAAQDDGRQQAAQDQPQVSGTDWEKAVAERDEKIAALEAQVAEAAKNAETAEQLRCEIAELKAQGESDRIDFKLQLAGVRNVKAARAILADHGGAVTNGMDERQVSTGSRILFITPTLRGVLDDFSLANPTRSNRVLERFSRIVEVPQVRFYTAIDLLSGDDDQFGYQKATGTYVATTDTEVDSTKTYYTKSGDEYTAVASPTKSGLSSYYELKGAGADINFMVVEKSAVIKYDKHVASRVFSPDELEALDSCMLKYRKYGIVSVLENKLDGVYVSAGTE